jgi:ADP-ribosylglycohydrolase
MSREFPLDHGTRIHRARTSLEGLSVGDAFGERFFGSPDSALAKIRSRTLPRAPWSTTDETELGLAVVEVLDRYGGIEQSALADRFADRYQSDPSRGYGATATGILRAIGEGISWRVVALEPYGGEGSMGNGGAGRAGPIGAYFADDLRHVAAHARAAAEVTHAHPEGQAGAVAVAVAAATAWRMRQVPRREEFLETVLAHVPRGETHRGIAEAAKLAPNVSIEFAARKLGNGANALATDTVPFAIYCAARHLDDYVEAMWSTVSALGDRDTTCAIVGSIVALSARESTFPASWRDAREPLGDRVPDSYHMTLATGRSVPPPKD